MSRELFEKMHGHFAEVKGRVSILLQFGKKDYISDLVVTPTLFSGVDIILGNDFFSKYHTKLITYPHKEPLFILENQVIPLIKADSSDSAFQVFHIVEGEEGVLGPAKTIKPVHIPAWGEGYIKIRLPKCINKNKDRKTTQGKSLRYPGSTDQKQSVPELRNSKNRNSEMRVVESIYHATNCQS